MIEAFRTLLPHIEQAEVNLNRVEAEAGDIAAATGLLKRLKKELRELNDRYAGSHFLHHENHLYRFCFVSRSSELDPATGRLTWMATYENEEGDYWNRPFECSLRTSR